MLGLKLIHVSKRGPIRQRYDVIGLISQNILAQFLPLIPWQEINHKYPTSLKCMNGQKQASEKMHFFSN